MQRERYLQLKNFLQTPTILALIFFAPMTVILFWFTATSLDGSLQNLGALIKQEGFLNVLSIAWGPIAFGTPTAWKILAIFFAVQLTLMKLVPGPTFLGPISPKGNRPVYKANGLACFALSITLFIACSSLLHLFPLTIIYDNFGGLLGALNIFALVFCVLLFIKGHIASSSSDSGTTHNALLDFYWGMELYPRILGWDVKMFTNCRFAMMSWPLILISFAAKQHELHGLSDSMTVAVTLQLIYVAKFFYWETGYLSSLDIMHDRAGYYICWGCLVWVPGIYTLSTLYLVNHPNHLGLALSTLILTAGTTCIAINYLADRQRQRIRRTNGQCTIWRKEPKLLQVKYQTEQGEWKENLLLHSGWWGLSRHFHYLAEILAAFFWILPSLFDNFLPYFYLPYLTILLLERAYRDDKRCADKYKDGWNSYCQKVPHKVIPYIL